MRSRRRWAWAALCLVILVGSTGCTARQKVLKYVSIAEAGYQTIKLELGIWVDRYEIVRTVVENQCALGSLSPKTCEVLGKGDGAFVAAYQAAQRLDAKAKEIGAAKDRALKTLSEMERALTEAGIPSPPPTEEAAELYELAGIRASAGA